MKSTTLEKGHFFDSSDDVCDEVKDLTSQRTGQLFARVLESLAESSRLQLPAKPVLLGLGAGTGKAEQAMAAELNAKVAVLVDKDPRITYNCEVREVSVVRQGIFEFLSTTPTGSFDVITAIGLEYMLNQVGRTEELLRLVVSALTVPGFICFYPNVTLSCLPDCLTVISNDTRLTVLAKTKNER